MGVLRGANAPLLQRRVLEELAKEKLVMEQGGARRTVGRHTHTHTHTHTTTHTEVHTLWQPLNEPGSTYKSRLAARD